MEFIDTILLSVTLSQVLTYGFLAMIAMFMVIIWKFSQSPENKFHLLHLISNPDGTASLTRFLQFVAGVTATWAIIKTTVLAKLTPELFGIYLAAMGISEGFTKWIQATKTPPKKEEE